MLVINKLQQCRKINVEYQSFSVKMKEACVELSNKPVQAGLMLINIAEFYHIGMLFIGIRHACGNDKQVAFSE